MYHPIIDRLKRIAELLPTAIGGGGITPTGTKTINITQNGTVTEDVTNYANAEVITNVPNDITDSLKTLGFTIVSDSTITGTRTTGSILVAFGDMGVNAGESVIVLAIDKPTLNQAIIKLTGTYGGAYRAGNVLRYPNEYKTGVNGDVNAFLETGKKYRVIIFKP